MAKKMENLKQLFQHELNYLYDVENQITEALPKMIKQASNSELKDALENHLNETKEQVKRLEEACKKAGFEIKEVTDKGIQGIIREGEDFIKENADPQVRDAGLIAIAQKVEHYEIAAYGTICTWAENLDMRDVRDLLVRNLEEEKKADSKLTNIASKVNEKALA